MGKIVAIGGGELRLGETKAIDQYIVGLCGKESPKLLFLPTASHDAPGYVEAVEKEFGSMGCTVQALCLTSQTYTQEEIKSSILGADIIYVGGGSTAFMMDCWKKYGVDGYLRQAYEQGTVLSGLSAGSICWFAFGHSDSDLIDGTGQAYRFVDGLGLLPYFHCPHYDEKGREGFDAMAAEFMEKNTMPAIALENQTALLYIDGACQIIKEKPEKKAYMFTWENGACCRRELY